MSKSYSKSFIIRLFVLFVSVTFLADLYVSAQNSNSSTTTDDNMTMQNSNSTKSKPRLRRRRRRAAVPTPPACGPMDGSMPAEGAMAATGRCDPNKQEQTDLSGTYTGTVNYSEGGLSGDATLTITGNNFSMTSGSSTQEGRVVAVTTCNYTAVTMMFGKDQTTAATGPQPPPLPAVSLQAEKMGGGMSLTSVDGEKRAFSFTSSGGGTGSSMRPKRRAPKVMIKPPTVVGNFPD